MARWSARFLSCALALFASATLAHAQVKILPGEHQTISATVEGIETSTRMLTLRGPAGNLRTVHVPADVKRFSTIKVGDTVQATYYDNVILRVKQPGEAAVDTLEGAGTATPGQKPGATVAAQQTITATIDAIDMNVPSISFKGPRGWAYTQKVQDKKALAQVKVGDRVDITWTEAVLVTVGGAKGGD